MKSINHGLPPFPGAYGIHFILKKDHTIQIGHLGRNLFPAGDYIYLGSAKGPGGIRARVGRYLFSTSNTKKHWHLDYLRDFSMPISIYIYQWDIGNNPSIPVECAWSQALLNLPSAYTPMEKFGSSDCRYSCPSHLVAFSNPIPSSRYLSKIFQQSLVQIFKKPVERIGIIRV
jgi:Uri superfamily endonuclease